MRVFILLSLLTLPVYAQHSSQPVKEATHDLRSGLTLFSLTDLGSEKTFWLERTQGLDYFLHMKEGSEEKMLKLASTQAKKLDQDFAAKFLNFQYSGSAPEEGCKIAMKLNMKGEALNVCAKEERKTQEMEPFVKDLAKYF